MKNHIWIKIGQFVACLLLLVSFLVTVGCGIGIKYLNEYSPEEENMEVIPEEQQDEKLLADLAKKLLKIYVESGIHEVDTYCKDTGIHYAVYRNTGRRVGANMTVADEEKTLVFSFSREELGYEFVERMDEYKIKLYLDPGEDAGVKFSLYRDFLEWVPKNRALLEKAYPIGIITCVVCYLLALFLFRIGRKGEPTTGRIPVDLLTFMVAVLLYLCCRWLPGWLLKIGVGIWAIPLCRVVAALAGMGYSLYLIPGILCAGWYRRTFCYLGCRCIRDIIRNLSLVWKFVLGWLILCALQAGCILLILPSERTTLLFLGVFGIWKLVSFPCLLYPVLVLKKFHKAARELSAGNLNYKIQLNYMPKMFRSFAADMNTVADSVGIAVEERLKSEHLKTELITNVSHDIKTPLTSIINFSDLIVKEKSENPKIAEYAEHLYKQSSRLKKLIEDLMEASKASTGNLEVNLQPCDVRVLLGQCLGEYEQKLAQQDIDLIIRQCPEPLWIIADTKMLWRIFDNLMNNICKYTQSNTRVYLSTETVGDKVRITFKNISRYPLDVSADDLMERFVRGDLSRHTEGNGLGLSIVRSLMDLQHGEINLAVDGDLFKAVLEFETTDAPRQEAL